MLRFVELKKRRPLHSYLQNYERLLYPAFYNFSFSRSVNENIYSLVKQTFFHPATPCFSLKLSFNKVYSTLLNTKKESIIKRISNSTKLKASKGRKTSSISLNKSEKNLVNPSTVKISEQPQIAQLQTINKSLSSLRPYQQECIEATLKNLSLGIMRQVVSLPVGTGKTVVMAHLIPLIPSPTLQATKTLVLAHRQELLFQAMQKISHNCPDLIVDIERGKHKCDLTRTDVIIASVQSLGVTTSTRLERFDPKLFKCIIIDEAHHASAATYNRVLAHFGLLQNARLPTTNRNPTAHNNLEDHIRDSHSDLKQHILLWGCSATLRRHDGVGLASVFDFISYHKDFLAMVKEKWLCDIQVTTIKTQVDLSHISSREGDFMQSQLAPVIDTPQRNELIIHTFKRLAEGRRSTLVFAVDINHVENLVLTFRSFGLNAVAISSKTPPDLRIEYLNKFRKQEIPILINCSILTEGLDVPSVDCLIMARPTRSKPLYQQMLGRGMRIFPGKSNCLVLDFVDLLRDKSLCTTPTLLGLEYDTDLHSKSLTKALSEKVLVPSLERSLPTPPSTIQNILVRHYDSIEALEQKEAESINHINCISNLEWIMIKHGLYTLHTSSGIFRLEQQSDNSYRVKMKRALPSGISMASHSSPTTLPIEADNLEMAVRGAETFLTKKYSRVLPAARRKAPWRFEEISDSQVKFLDKLFPNDTPLSHTLRSSLKDLTKGQASNIIAFVREGGLKDYRRLLNQALKKSQSKKTEAQEEISVGPLSQ